MKKLKILLASLIVGLGTLVATPAPANAGWFCDNWGICGKMYHHAPDDGYDPAIIVTCNWNTKAQTWVYEGDWSPCRDMDGIYARPGEDIVCYRPDIGIWQVFVENGWVKVHDQYSNRCVAQLD